LLLFGIAKKNTMTYCFELGIHGLHFLIFQKGRQAGDLGKSLSKKYSTNQSFQAWELKSNKTAKRDSGW
jgi:hypothetical protein